MSKMDWYLWLVVVWWVLNLVMYVYWARTHKVVRFKPGDATFGVIIFSGLIIGLLVTR